MQIINIKPITPKNTVIYLSRELKQNNWNISSVDNEDDYFTDHFDASSVSGSNKGIGLLSRNRSNRSVSTAGHATYITSSVTIDSSGNNRIYLSPDAILFTSSSVDAFRNGIEITSDKIWAAGSVKIMSDHPGHMWDNISFGFTPEHNFVNSRSFVETNDIVGQSYLVGNLSYPIPVDEGQDVNGVIEVFPIREIIYGTSIEFPFYSRGIKGSLDSGNEDQFKRNNQISDIIEISEVTINDNSISFNDSVWQMSISGNYVGPINGYFNSSYNTLMPFDDSQRRIHVNGPSEFDWLLKDKGNCLLSDYEISATAGFVYDGGSTDSIAFGGFKY